MLQLPCDPAELAIDLNRPLASRDRRQLHVEAVSVEHGDAPNSARVVLLVKAVPGPGGEEEQWRVAIPVSPDDLDPMVTRQALVTTLRANLEEWWDTKSFDPMTRNMGTRVRPTY
jgi:hypothetical protein